MKTKAFTLLELMIVIIILAILVALAILQYQTVMERSRAAEAKEKIGYLRKMCGSFYNRDKNVSNCDEEGLGLGRENSDTPVQCRPDNFFSYSVFLEDQTVDNQTAAFTATRCLAGGKEPNAKKAGSITLSVDYETGKDTWSSAGVY